MSSAVRVAGKMAGVMRWSDRTVELVADFSGAIAEVPEGDDARGSTALEGLSRMIPFDCAVLCRTDAVSLSAVASIGYDRPVESAVAREEYRREQQALGMDSSGSPMRFGDLPGGGRQSFTVTELAWPAGLHDGMGMTICSRGGAVGHIALNAVKVGVFSDEHRDLLAMLQRLLCAVVGGAGPTPSTSPRCRGICRGLK